MVFEAATRQHGVISLDQLFDEGFSQSKISRMLGKGLLHRYAKSVYRVAGAKVTRKQAMMASCLSCRSDIFVSHVSAAELHTLKTRRDSAIHLTTADVRPSQLRNLKIHQTGELPKRDVTTVENIPVTSVARTIVDLAECMSARALAIVVDDALQRKLVDLRQLTECHERVGRWAGRKRFRPIKEVLAERVDSAKVESVLERRILRTIRASDLPNPKLQYQFMSYRLDMAYPQFRIGIEVDGYAFHSDRDKFDSDRARDNALRAAGWTIVHFTANTPESEVLNVLKRLIRDVG